MRTICGFVRFTTRWFEDDPDGTTKEFFVYGEDRKLVFDPELREHWKAAIRPKYRNRIAETALLVYGDCKSNYRRREHPFCRGYIDFIEKCNLVSQGRLRQTPIVVMDAGTDAPKCVTKGLVGFQLIWRAKHAAHALRTNPDVLFDPSLDQMVLRIRGAKCGISVDTMQQMWFKE